MKFKPDIRIGAQGGGAAAFGVRPLGVATYTYGMGKGLSEPCSPYRSAYVFGAELNVPDASNWACIPEIIEPTTAFDLSTITPFHEVVVALLASNDLPYGTYTVRMKWYRNRDSKLLYEYVWTGWPWYVYSYIGYVDWEINENGNYHVDITLTGNGESYSRTINFTVSGISLAGYYAQITELTAPASANPGNTVNVSVKVKNLYSSSIIMAVTGKFNGTVITFSPSSPTVGAGSTQTFTGSFIMPSSSVTVTVWSWYWTGTDWYQDDSATADISVGAVGPTFNAYAIDDYVKV